MKNKKLTLKQLQQWGACEGGVDWFKTTNPSVRTVTRILSALVEDQHGPWANWLIVRLMTHPQQVAYAIRAAETVIDKFEANSQDPRPRKAIATAKAFLRGEVTTQDCQSAAHDAVYAAYAANYAANAAAYAAANAAYAAHDAANAYDAAANAAYAAAYAAYAAHATAANAADSADAAHAAFWQGQISYGADLLGLKIKWTSKTGGRRE